MERLSDVGIIFLVVFVIVIAILFLVGELIHSGGDPMSLICLDSTNNTQACLDYRVERCLRTEKYTRDQCVMLVGK